MMSTRKTKKVVYLNKFPLSTQVLIIVSLFKKNSCLLFICRLLKNPLFYFLSQFTRICLSSCFEGWKRLRKSKGELSACMLHFLLTQIDTCFFFFGLFFLD